MICTMNIARLSAAAAVVWIALAACSAQAPMTSPDAPVVATLIVKPKVTTSDPATVLKTMRVTLGQSAGVRYVRALAGDAHLVHLTAPAQQAEVPQMMERLRASGAFQYVELDSMMKIQ